MVQSDSTTACVTRKHGVKQVTWGLKSVFSEIILHCQFSLVQEVGGGGVTAKTFESHCPNYSSPLNLRENRLWLMTADSLTAKHKNKPNKIAYFW